MYIFSFSADKNSVDLGDSKLIFQSREQLKGLLLPSDDDDETSAKLVSAMAGKTSINDCIGSAKIPGSNVQLPVCSLRFTAIAIILGVEKSAAKYKKWIRRGTWAMVLLVCIVPSLTRMAFGNFSMWQDLFSSPKCMKENSCSVVDPLTVFFILCTLFVMVYYVRISILIMVATVLQYRRKSLYLKECGYLIAQSIRHSGSITCTYPPLVDLKKDVNAISWASLRITLLDFGYSYQNRQNIIIALVVISIAGFFGISLVIAIWFKQYFYLLEVGMTIALAVVTGLVTFLFIAAMVS